MPVSRLQELQNAAYWQNNAEAKSMVSTSLSKCKQKLANLYGIFTIERSSLWLDKSEYVLIEHSHGTLDTLYLLKHRVEEKLCSEQV